jgi:hypothetical protein
MGEIMDPKMIKEAVKAITNICMHKGTNKHLTEEDVGNFKEFNNLVKQKLAKVEHCREVFDRCKEVRKRSKGKSHV